MKTCPGVLFAGLVLLSQTAAAGGTLVVLNKSEATASLIDLEAGNVVATLPTGEGPHEVAVSPDGRLALASNYGTRVAPGSTLTLIDIPGARVVKTIELGEYRRPHGVAWLQDGKRALVTAEAQKALLTIDVEAGKVAGAILTDQDVSHMVAVLPDGSRAFVANIGSGTVTAIDLSRGKVLAQIPTGKGAEGIDITPDGRQVWVTNRAEDTVSVLDPSGLKSLATLESKAFPIRARATPDGKHVLVSNAKTGDVAVFDTRTRALVRRIGLQAAAVKAEGRLLEFGDSSVPIGIAIDPAKQRAFVAHANADVISIIDLLTWQPKGTLTAGKEPDGMAYSPLTVKPGGR